MRKQRDYDNIGEALDYLDWIFDTAYDTESKRYWGALSNFIKESIQKFGSEGEKNMYNYVTTNGTDVCCTVDDTSFSDHVNKLNKQFIAGIDTQTLIGKICNEYTLKSQVELTADDAIYESIYVRKIIRNGPATIVFWDDNTKTIVMRKKGEKDDPYYAFCAALTKKVYGTNSHIKRMLDQVTVDDNKKKHISKK